MAEEVEMTPVAPEPPKVNPLATASTLKTGLKLPPKPAFGAGLKLPPKPGATISTLKSGLKLPPKPGLATGLKLPTKPGATISTLKSGLKLPPRPGATVAGRPLIRKPGATVSAAPLPKPIAKPVVPVDAQGVGKLPTVTAQTMDRQVVAQAPVEAPKPMETLKTVTQKLKGITQAIPQQAILRKTGIIADSASETQKEAAKHKTARISLSEAMGVAPVRNESAPMKTIRIKRPVNLPTTPPTATLEAPKAPVSPVSATPVVPQAVKSTASEAKTIVVPPVQTAETTSAPAPASAPESVAGATAPTPSAGTTPAVATPSTSVTQRKTLKIARPGTAIRPTGKFGVKKPASQATTIAKKPTVGSKAAAPASAEGEVADIPDLPEVSAAAPAPHPVEEAKPGIGTSLAIVVQLAASVAIGALAWFLYENTQTLYF